MTDPSYFGYAVGHWEGDTLVVDTVGFNDDTLLNGMPHSDAAHLLERYARPDLDTLELNLTVTDPKAYTKPWTAGPIKLAWHPDWQLVEAFCLQDDNSSFKQSVMDPSWNQGQGGTGAKPASSSSKSSRAANLSGIGGSCRVYVPTSTRRTKSPHLGCVPRLNTRAGFRRRQTFRMVGAQRTPRPQARVTLS